MSINGTLLKIRRQKSDDGDLPPMPLLRSYLYIYDGLQHTSAASSSPSIILSIYGRNFLPLAYSLQKIGVHIDEDGKIIVDVMHWYELNLKALYGLMSLVYCAVYTWIYINGLVDYIRMPILTRWSRLRHRVHYHPNAQQHSTMQQSTSYEKGLCRNQ